VERATVQIPGRPQNPAGRPANVCARTILRLDDSVQVVRHYNEGVRTDARGMVRDVIPIAESYIAIFRRLHAFIYGLVTSDIAVAPAIEVLSEHSGTESVALQ
jgi:hypothetical protein